MGKDPFTEKVTDYAISNGTSYSEVDLESIYNGIVPKKENVKPAKTSANGNSKRTEVADSESAQ